MDILTLKKITERFVYYSALIKGFKDNKDLLALTSRREQLFSTAKLKEYLIADIFRGNIAEEIGCDITCAKLFGNKRIEVKSCQNPSVLKKDKTFGSHKIIIMKPLNNDDFLTINSDYFLLNFEHYNFSVLLKSKYIGMFATKYQGRYFFNVKNLNHIEHIQINWPDSSLSLNRQCILNLLKYGTSPDPQEEYGYFEDYMKFCIENQSLNFYKTCRNSNNMNNLNKNEKQIFEFIAETKPTSDHNQYKKVYKDFVKYADCDDIKFDEFEEIILNLKNYYFLITPDYDESTGSYKPWIIRKVK